MWEQGCASRWMSQRNKQCLLWRPRQREPNGINRLRQGVGRRPECGIVPASFHLGFAAPLVGGTMMAMPKPRKTPRRLIAIVGFLVAAVIVMLLMPHTAWGRAGGGQGYHG